MKRDKYEHQYWIIFFICFSLLIVQTVRELKTKIQLDNAKIQLKEIEFEKSLIADGWELGSRSCAEIEDFSGEPFKKCYVRLSKEFSIDEDNPIWEFRR